MITASDSFTTIELKDYYAILPSDGRIQKLYQTNGIKFEPVPHGFAYNSGTNPRFLTVEEIRKLIQENVNSNFEPT